MNFSNGKLILSTILMIALCFSFWIIALEAMIHWCLSLLV